MNEFYGTLKGTEKVMYKMAYNFHKNHSKGATEESAHQAGLKEISRLVRLREDHAEPETWVDITTGETHKANY